METTIKLNARGTIIYVDEDILIKSHYFRHVIKGEGFQKSLPDNEGAYYVDCDHDVMTELIAYMETGHFKYKKINPNYLSIMLNKYGIDKEKPENKHIEKINQMLDKIIEYIASDVMSKFCEKISVQFLDCNSDEIEIVILDTGEDSIHYRRYGKKELTLGCKYNGEVYPISSSFLEKNKKMIYLSLKKNNLDKMFFVKITGYKNTAIELNKIPEDNRKINRDDNSNNGDDDNGEEDEDNEDNEDDEDTEDEDVVIIKN